MQSDQFISYQDKKKLTSYLEKYQNHLDRELKKTHRKMITQFLKNEIKTKQQYKINRKKLDELDKLKKPFIEMESDKTYKYIPLALQYAEVNAVN